MDTVAGCVEIHDNAIPYAPEIVALLEKQTEWAPATLSGNVVNESIRNNSGLFINPLSYRVPETIYRFGRDVFEHLDNYGQRFGVSFSGVEDFYVNRYLPGERYEPHADSSADRPRVISAVVYLNDVADGGATHFTNFDVTVEAQAGRLIIFPSNYAYSHASLPVVSGVKYSVAIWTTP